MLVPATMALQKKPPPMAEYPQANISQCTPGPPYPHASAYNAVLRYLIPESFAAVTTVWSGSRRPDTRNEAASQRA
jgi:hypothetical protein